MCELGPPVKDLNLLINTYGLVYGMETCFICNSYFMVFGTHFKQKLSLAVGRTPLGSIAGVLYSGPLLQALLGAFGRRNTLRIMTATFALVCILSLNFKKRQHRKWMWN